MAYNLRFEWDHHRTNWWIFLHHWWPKVLVTGTERLVAPFMKGGGDDGRMANWGNPSEPFRTPPSYWQRTWFPVTFPWVVWGDSLLSEWEIHQQWGIYNVTTSREYIVFFEPCRQVPSCPFWINTLRELRWWQWISDLDDGQPPHSANMFGCCFQICS